MANDKIPVDNNVPADSMGDTELPIDWQIEVADWNDGLERELISRLNELAKNRRDITSAAVSITLPAKASTTYTVHARIVIYMRPEQVVAKEDSNTTQGALKGALLAVERQVRELRKKLDESWKRADLPGAPGSNTPFTKGENG